MDGKTVLKILKQHGFECVRINGSHHIICNGKQKPFPVPVGTWQKRFKDWYVKKY